MLSIQTPLSRCMTSFLKTSSNKIPSSAFISNYQFLPSAISSYRASLSLDALNYCLCIESKSAGFLVRKYWQTGSFIACQTEFRTEFGKRRAPSKCCTQKLVKKLETRGSRSKACRLLSLGPIEGQSVQKYTPHNRTTQRRYTLIDSSRQLRHFGKSIPEFGETHSSVLGCERDQFQHRL